jgi:hypothetical protein
VSRAVPLFPVHAFMAWTEIALTLLLCTNNRVFLEDIFALLFQKYVINDVKTFLDSSLFNDSLELSWLCSVEWLDDG